MNANICNLFQNIGRGISKKSVLVKAASAFAAAGILLAAQNASASVISFGDGSSLIKVNTKNDHLTAWSDNGADELGKELNFYRLDDSGKAQSFKTLTLESVKGGGSNDFLDLDYQGKGFTIDVDYKLTAGTSGSNLSNLSETISINNDGNKHLSIQLAQLDNFSLGASGTVGIDKGNTITDSNAQGMVTQIVDHGAPDGYEAGDFTTLKHGLRSGKGFSIDGPSDYTGTDAAIASDWNFCIPMCDSDTIKIDQTINADPPASVPEPASLSILGLASGMLMMRRRK